MSEEFYYLEDGHQRIGPVSWNVLEQLHQAGTITDETPVASNAAPEWTPYSQWWSDTQNSTAEAPTPPSEQAPSPAPSSGKRSKKPKKQVGKIERIVIRIILGFIGFLVLFVAFMMSPLVHHPFLQRPMPGTIRFHPEKAPLTEIAKAIEAMPRTHHSIPDRSSKDKGVMLLFTGENSVQVRAIPDHQGLFQIDLTRYGVVYSDLPSDPGTRNALTLRLNLGTQFVNGKWELVHAKGGSVDQITKPGQSIADETTTESIPQKEAMWHGQWVVDFLNGKDPDPKSEKENADRYRFLEESFLQEHQKLEAIRAQGIRLPE